MAELDVTRWQKYGHDRLYVKDAAGTIGWLDRKTAAVTLDRPDLSEEFHNALHAWHVAHAGETLEPVMPAPRTQTARPSPNRGRDLSLNRPGEAVRGRAAAEWSAARQRHPVLAPVVRFLDVKTDERAWRVGAAGEEKVGPKLESLSRNGWRVIHSVPVGASGSDIDHVLIGPGGVFTINTKYHPGARVWVGQYQVRVNNRPTHYLTNSRHEGERAAKRLTAALGWDVPVTPALVILTGGFEPNITYKQRPDDVLVLDAWDLPRFFKRRTGVLGHEAVAAVFEVARWEGTWVPTQARALGDPASTPSHHKRG
jgi:hypothetical protein